MMLIYLTTFCCLISLNCLLVYSFTDPYDVLGVKKTASINEIKRNYKNLIKVWHPDTNPESNYKYLEINEAYKLLMDPERREDFDKHAITVETPNFQKKPDYSSLRRFELEDEDYSDHDSIDKNETEKKAARLKFNHMDTLYKQTISHKAYSNKIIPASTKHPQLILFYSDMPNQCPLCSTTSVIWQRISNELFSIGIHLHTINVDKDSKLARKVGINTNQLPSIIGITDEVVKYYKEDQITLHKIILFIRRIIRSTLIKKINYLNYKEFLDGWRFENKVRVLFVNQDKSVRLRYLVTAFKFREYASCGHVTIDQTNARSLNFNANENKTYLNSLPINLADLAKATTTNTNQDIINKFKLDPSLSYVLVFNENSSWPEVILSSANGEFKLKLVWETIESNKFLLFPKITSQANFEQICPVESIRNKRILCTILIASKKDASIDKEMTAMREFIKLHMFNRKKFKFGYITLEDQKAFLSALITNQTKNIINNNHSFKKYFNDENNRLKGNDLNENTKDLVIKSESVLNEYKMNVVVITRRKWDHILYEWLDDKWNARDINFSRTKNSLYDLLIKLSSPEILNSEFPYETKIIPLIDENEKTIFGRIIFKLILFTEHLNENFTKREVLQIISVILSVLFIFLIGYTMQYLVKMEEQKIDETYKKLGKRRPDTVAKQQKINLENRLLIHELRGETYNGLIRLLKPGCRTIVLLCDMESRNKLLPKFYKAAFPYRKNKTLMFAYMMLEKNVGWYREILEQALDKKNMFLNPKNCIGTVLSLNGFRKHFCMYHAKHMELNNMNNCNSGDLSESETSDIESGNLLNEKQKPFYSRKTTVLIDDFLLDGLEDWLDKLFYSKTVKYFINYWPQQMK